MEEKSHIGCIKIYDGEGNLKEEISAKQATKLHEKNYVISKTARLRIKHFLLEEEEDTYKPYVHGRKSVFRDAKYEVTCALCNKKVMRRSEEAVYCGQKCRQKQANNRARELRGNLDKSKMQSG